VFRSDRPKFASTDRRQGTPDENKATIQGSLAYFGTYSVNEEDKTLVSRIEGSTFPNSEGEQQKRVITRLTMDELRYINPATTLGARAEAVWKRVKQAQRKPQSRGASSLPILRINVAPSKLLQRRISGVEPNAVRYFIAIVAFADDAAESAMLAKLVPAAEIH
jgi:hypothetical protein